MLNLTKKNVLMIAAIILVSAVAGLIVYAAVTYVSIPGNGSVLTAASLTVSPANIDWGGIPVGSVTPITKSFTLTNNGETATAPLKMTYSMSPGTIGVVSWNRENAVIQAGTSLACTVTLTPSASAPAGEFTGIVTIGGA